MPFLFIFSDCVQSLNDASGELTSPGYPHYVDRENFEWVIHSFARNGAILLIFDPFDMPPSINCRYCLQTVSNDLVIVLLLRMYE